MIVKISKDAEKLLEQASKITLENRYDNLGEIETAKLFYVIEDLINSYNSLQEQYDDLEQDLEDNYTPRPKYDIDENDFH